MSADYCLTGVGSRVNIGRRNASVKGISATELQVRTDDDTAFAQLGGADGTALEHFVTLNQLNAVSSGLSFKESVRLCEQTNINIASAPATIDGIAPNVGDRISLDNQTTATENGLWLWNGAGNPLTRPPDWLPGTDQSGSAFIIREGTCAELMFVASADPAVVNADDPLLIVIASVAAGVTSVTDQVAPGVGQASLLANPGTGAVTTNIVGSTATIAVNLAAAVLTFNVVANSITNVQIAPATIRNAELAPGAAVSYVQGTFDFTDQGSTVNITGLEGVVPANSTIVGVDVQVTQAFDDPALLVTVEVGATPVMASDKSDLALLGLYHCSDPVVANGTVTATINSGTPTQGTAIVTVCFLRTA